MLMMSEMAAPPSAERPSLFSRAELRMSEMAASGLEMRPRQPADELMSCYAELRQMPF